VYPATLLEENKWRAVRYGLDGKLIDFGKQREAPARALIREMLEWFVDDVVDELGSRREVEYALRILDEGTSADRQLAVYRNTGKLHDVVDLLIRETAEGVSIPEGLATRRAVAAAPMLGVPAGDTAAPGVTRDVLASPEVSGPAS
jgi:carboxylate-amine ligase